MKKAFLSILVVLSSVMFSVLITLEVVNNRIPKLVSDNVKDVMGIYAQDLSEERLFEPFFAHAPVPREGFRITPVNGLFDYNVVIRNDGCQNFVAGIYVKFAPNDISYTARIETDWHHPVMVTFKRGPGTGVYYMGERIKKTTLHCKPRKEPGRSR